MKQLYLLGLLILLISIIFVVDTLQILIRLYSGNTGNPVLGAHIASVIMLINRAATASALLLIGYLIDTGVDYHKLLYIYFLASFLIASIHIFLLKFNIVSFLNKFLFNLLYGIKIEYEFKSYIFTVKETIERIWFILIIISCVAYIGLLLPSIFASAYPEYRAALMQTGFLINTFATIGYVVFVERKIALAISTADIDKIDEVYYLYLNSRSISFIIIGLISIFIINL